MYTLHTIRKKYRKKPSLDSRLTTHDSRLSTLDSRLSTLDSRLTTHDSRLTTHDSRLTIHDSRLTTHTAHAQPAMTHATESVFRMDAISGGAPVEQSSGTPPVVSSARLPLSTTVDEPYGAK